VKILYYTTYDGGVGADRWITTGYKNAFAELGHEFYTTESERCDLNKKIAEILPDIFIFPIQEIAVKENVIPAIKDLRVRGAKTFVFVDTSFRDYMDCIRTLESHNLVNFYYGYYAEELMKDFQNETGRQYYQIPLAANSKIHFPVSPDKDYESDIVFIGGRLPDKEIIFKKLLFPLAKKYNLKIYGPNWTLEDKVLRMLSGAGRMSGMFSLADWANEKRITISPEDERKVYSSSKICINIHEYNPDGSSKNFSNEREFKIPACGGFQISDYVTGIEKLFVPGKEIVVPETDSEWFDAIDYYIHNEEKRKEIQENGTKRALGEHTYLHRAKEIMRLAGLAG